MMLIIEKTSNGQSMVVVKKDWHPNRIGRAYQPNKNYVDSYFMEKLQGALLVFGAIMSHTVYDIARQLKTPGVYVSASFNPTRLSKTLQNLARKSILSGYHTGGWSSQTNDVRKLIFSLAGEEPTVYVTQYSDYMGLHIYREVSKSAMSEIIGLFEADATLQKMDYDAEKGSYRPTREEYYKQVDERCVENTTKLKFAHRTKGHKLIVRTPELRKQIAAVFLKERSVEDIAIAEHLARMLDKNQEYAVSTTRSYF